MAGDVLIVARRDRLARDVMLAGWIEKEAQKRGASIVSAAGEGNGGTNDPATRLMRQIIDCFAEYERALIRARTKAALATKRAEGKRVSRHPPFGYDHTADGRLAKNAQEQKAIRLMARWRDEGHSLGDISARLERRGRVVLLRPRLNRRTRNRWAGSS